jgi:hypothetical protein
MAKVGVLRDPETKEQYFPITVADAVIGLTPGGGVTVTGTSPIAVSNNVVSIDNAYGDTKNPYGAKSAHTFLAGPTSGSAAVPSFRTLDITDIQTPLPDLYAIESLTGTSGLLKKTAANTWELDTNTYLTSHQTIYALTLQAAGVTIGSAWNPASAAATLNIPVYSVDSNNLGVAGLVPAATAGDNEKFLRGDGTWQTVGGGGSGTVTQVTAGSGLNTTSGDTTTDGGNITTNGTLHLTKCNNNIGSFGPSSNASPAAGGTFVVPRITVDKWGRVTAASDKTITLPNSGGGGGSSTKNMAAYDWFGPVINNNNNVVSFKPVHFLTALMKPILDDSASNDVSIITSDVLVSENGSADGHLPIGALILLYAGYLHILGYSYGRIVVDSTGYGDYSNYFIGHDDSPSWKDSTNGGGNTDSETVLNSINAKVVFFNWNDIQADGLPLGPSDYNTTAAGISASANERHFNRYTFTFSSVIPYGAGSDIGQLTAILDAIKNEPDVTATTNSDNLINLCQTPNVLANIFKKMVVTVEHRSVRSAGYSIFG